MRPLREVNFDNIDDIINYNSKKNNCLNTVLNFIEYRVYQLKVKR